MSKPALSSRLLGLKFMQRGKEKEEKAAAEVAAEERDAEASKPLFCSVLLLAGAVTLLCLPSVNMVKS